MVLPQPTTCDIIYIVQTSANGTILTQIQQGISWECLIVVSAIVLACWEGQVGKTQTQRVEVVVRRVEEIGWRRVSTVNGEWRSGCIPMPSITILSAFRAAAYRPHLLYVSKAGKSRCEVRSICPCVRIDSVSDLSIALVPVNVVLSGTERVQNWHP